VPPDVEAILRKSITETAEARYRDSGEMRADLEVALHRLAPGYNPDTLARELRRLIGSDRTPSQPLALDTTRQATPSRGVSVRAVKWRGMPTAEHSLPASASVSASFDGTPIQNPGILASTTQPSLAPLGRNRTSSQSFEIEAERTMEEVRTIPPDFMPNPAESQLERSLRRRGSIDRRLGIGLIVAALALVTVGIAAAVAASGNNTPIAVEETQKPRPQAAPRVETHAMPLPATTGFVEVRGPVGATVQIGRTYYPSAPTRIELPAGDYAVRMRVGKKRRLVTHPVHVVAGNTITLR